MTKLSQELIRLYVPRTPNDRDAAPESLALVDPEGRVRAMVLALSRPADWSVLAKVWQGVQADLELPAPAIAVSGTGAYQLWFSLAEPVPATQAAVFLDALRARYLGEVRAERVDALPALDGSVPPTLRHAGLVPARVADSEDDGGRWSAFVAPDLAPVFADEPWLDTPPSPEGQAELLARLRSMPIADFERTLGQLQPPPRADERTAAVADTGARKPMASTRAEDDLDPRRFLTDVMNDRSVALALRIEAAKALLPGAPAGRAGRAG